MGVRCVHSGASKGILRTAKATPHSAHTRRFKVSNAGGGECTARAPPVEDFQPGQESERIGKGKGEVREGKVRAVDREVREEGKGEERDGRAALSLIKSMIFGRADCGQVDLNLWCFFFGYVISNSIM